MTPCPCCKGTGAVHHDAGTDPCPICEEGQAQAADLAYDRLKSSGELRRMEDHRALMYQLNEGPQ